MNVPTEFVATVGASVATMFIGLLSRIKANEAMIDDLFKRIQEVEERIYDHERRISRLENGWVK